MPYDAELLPNPEAKQPTVFDLLYAVRSLKTELLRGEPDLNALRWPGYSGSIVSLNLQFAIAYQEAYRDEIKSRVDYRMAPFTRGLDLQPFYSALNVKDEIGDVYSIQFARQFADVHGLPYPRFLRFCLQFADRKGRKQLARPSQLIPRSGPKLEEFMRQLDELIKNELPRLLSSFHASNPNVTAPAFPACQGVIGARNEKEPFCIACSHFKKCGKTVAIIEANIFKKEMKSGQAYTLAGRKRATEAAKQRKLYAKKKAEKNVPPHLKHDPLWTM